MYQTGNTSCDNEAGYAASSLAEPENPLPSWGSLWLTPSFFTTPVTCVTQTEFHVA